MGTKYLTIVIALSVAAFLPACGGGGSGTTEGSGGGGDGEMTISGVLTTATALNIAATKDGGVPPAPNVAAGYKVQVLNVTDGTQNYIDTAADGSFEFDVTSGDSVIVNFLNSNYQHEGILIVDADSVTTGLDTTNAGSETDMGTVVLNTTTGAALPENDIGDLADSDYKGKDDNGDGVPDGMTNNGAISGGVDSALANTYDEDGDGAPDIIDADDDNDMELDDQDGVREVSMCTGVDQMVLFVNNKRPINSIETEATGSNYVITQHVFPAEGYEISSVSVEGPSYLDDLIVGNSAFYDTEIAEGTAWDKNLVPCEMNSQANHCIFVRSSAETSLADEMAAGDVFVYTIGFSDGTSVVCTRMVNSVLNLTPRNVRIGDDDAAVGDMQSITSPEGINVVAIDADDDNRVKLAFDIPAGMQLGFTYRFDAFAYNAGCQPGDSNLPDMVAIDPTFTGDTRSSASDGLSDVVVILDWTNENWPASPIGAWQFDVTAQDDVGDNSAATGINIHSGDACGP